jgi:precorrin isomerase
LLLEKEMSKKKENENEAENAAIAIIQESETGQIVVVGNAP